LARIAGVDLPRNKHMDRALTYIYGIGLTSARQILDKADLPYSMNSDDLNAEEIKRIRKIIEENYRVEGDLRREVSMNIKRLLTWAVIGGCVTAAVFLVEASVPRPMRVPEGPGRTVCVRRK